MTDASTKPRDSDAASDDRQAKPGSDLPSTQVAGDQTGEGSTIEGVAQEPESEVAPEAGNGKKDEARDDSKGIADDIDNADGPEDGERGEEEEEDEDEDEDEQDEEEDDEDEDDEDEDDDEEEEEEPKLKYARLTQHLSPIYRGGDATSSLLVAGDKMIAGTALGIVHVIQLPTFQSLIAYNPHKAPITSISISPCPPPPVPTTLKPEAVARAVSQTHDRPSSKQSNAPPAGQRKRRELQPVPNIPSNNIHVATSSMDGTVYVLNLLDHRDVQRRNFARPVHAVALSPDFKNDRTYLSGGNAGSLVLTVGAPRGESTSSTVGTAAAAASGWLGTMGLGTNTGKDSILHSGEGIISSIKWSTSGKYVVWLNEHGIKIMRSKLHLDSADSEDAWKRIGHIDRPQTDEWDQMASAWKGRVEWIDEQSFSNDVKHSQPPQSSGPSSPATNRLRQQALQSSKQIERLLVGWGGTIWIIHVHPGSIGTGKHIGEKSVGRAEIVKILRMDCIISGISLYTQNLLLVLAYCQPDDSDNGENENGKGGDGKTSKTHKPSGSTASGGSEPSGGRRRRLKAQPPELRLIDLTSQAEVDKDGLTVSRFEQMSSNDYHLAVLPADRAASVVASRGALDALAGIGSEMWNAAINPKSLFNSGASIRSKDSNDAASGSKISNPTGSLRAPKPAVQSVHPELVKPGAKIFIHSLYDCILATQRDLGDHLAWLVEHEKYKDAWELLDEHPGIVNSAPEPAHEGKPSTPDRKPPHVDDFFDDSSSVADAHLRVFHSSAEKEKRRIGELWVQELVDESEWSRAAQVIAKVVNTPDRWEKWIYTFAGAQQFDAIVNFIPSEPMHPPLPGTVYEVVLGHYIQTDKPRFRELLELWGTDLFDVREVITALENQLKFRDVREDSIEDGEKGRDWRIVTESLAKLYETDGRYREALKCFIKLQDADSVMRLIRDNHLADAVTDDVPSFIALRVPQSEARHMTPAELAEATEEAITLLADEAERGLIPPSTVVRQLERKELNAYIYFYFKALWQRYRERPVDESISLVDDFADLAIAIFVLFDRGLLMDFLKVSTSYQFEKAVQECEAANFIPELVYLYSKTGQMKRALYLIIDRLADVSQAITFAKEQDDPDLWEDLLNYSMDKPRFIRGLLEEVGTAINPITLVRRIPEGLEIPGLREGIRHIMKEHEIQHSISSGVARVLHSEVAAAQSLLRSGQQKGIKFDVRVQEAAHTDVETHEVPTVTSHNGSDAVLASAQGQATPGHSQEGPHEQPGHSHREALPGHCAQCHSPFTEWETEALVGFVCGHVFHTSHLLETLHPGQTHDPSLLGINHVPGDGEEEGEDRMRGGRFVGSKVTHARLLRDKIDSGCPVCLRKMETVQGSIG